MNYENEQTFVIWKHYGIPDEESNLRLVMRLLAFAYGHCLLCTSLSGCYFENNIYPITSISTAKIYSIITVNCYLIPADDINLIQAFCPIE